jgi:chorismate dehydratase
MLQLLCKTRWKVKPHFADARAEAQDLKALAGLPHEAVLVIGDAALVLAAQEVYPYRYDLGEEWKTRTGLPFVFAIWAARRSADADAVGRVHSSLLASREWGLEHLDDIALEAATNTAIPATACREYLGGLDYGLSANHKQGLGAFLVEAAYNGLVPDINIELTLVA